MNGEQAAIALAVDGAIIDAGRAARILGAEASSIGWVAALEAAAAGLPPKQAAVRAIRREARKLGGTVSLDEPIRDDGTTRADRLASPASLDGHLDDALAVFADELRSKQARKTISQVPHLQRAALAIQHLGDGEVDDRLGTILRGRSMTKYLLPGAKAKGTQFERKVAELSVALYALGVDQLPAESAALVAAMVQLAARHPTELHRLATLEADLAAGRTGPGSPDGIVAVVAPLFGLPAGELANRSRRAQLVFARMVCWAACWRYSDASAKRIGKATGGHDHSAVSDSLVRFAGGTKDQPTVALRWAEACRQLEAAGLTPNDRPWPVRLRSAALRTCATAGCGSKLRSDNASGHCQVHHPRKGQQAA